MKNILLSLLLLTSTVSFATKKISILFDPATNTIVEGSGKSFGIRLDEAPSSDVTVSFSAQYGYTTFSSSLTFTSGNYSTPQSFTITGVDDGVINGNKVERVTLTASGGGYSSTKTFNINVTDSGLDYQFLNGYNWLYREYNGLTITSSGDIATRRATAIAYCFNGAGLPSDATPTAVTTGFTGTIGQTTTAALVGASSTNRLQWNFTDNTAAVWTHFVYHIFASSPNGKLAFVIGGHGSEGGHLAVINQLLASGYDIAYAFLPSTFQNTETNVGVTGTGTNAHNGIVTSGLDSGSFNGIELFFYDKIKSLNYFDANYSYTSYNITGCSGGGWSVLMLMALDTRFSNGVEVRGSMPIQFRKFTNYQTILGWDFEQGSVSDANGIGGIPGGSGQRLTDFYNTVTYFDLYLMACSGGRSIYLSHHAADSCCHGKFTYALWGNWMKSLAASYGGTFNLSLNTNASYATHGWNVNDLSIIAAEF